MEKAVPFSEFQNTKQEMNQSQSDSGGSIDNLIRYYVNGALQTHQTRIEYFVEINAHKMRINRLNLTLF